MTDVTLPYGSGEAVYRWSLPVRRPVLPLLRDASRAQEQAARWYRPLPYAGSVVLFPARPAGALPQAADPLGWARVAQGGVEYHDVPGGHLSIMRDPEVEELVRLLRICLQRARSTGR